MAMKRPFCPNMCSGCTNSVTDTTNTGRLTLKMVNHWPISSIMVIEPKTVSCLLQQLSPLSVICSNDWHSKWSAEDNHQSPSTSCRITPEKIHIISFDFMRTVWWRPFISNCGGLCNCNCPHYVHCQPPCHTHWWMKWFFKRFVKKKQALRVPENYQPKFNQAWPN